MDDYHEADRATTALPITDLLVTECRDVVQLDRHVVELTAREHIKSISDGRYVRYPDDPQAHVVGIRE